MKMYEFRLRFHWSLYLRAQLTISQHFGSDNDLAPNRRQAIIWTNTNPILWRIYAALGADELNFVKGDRVSLWHGPFIHKYGKV